ncbi:hemerythrin domain-containing protein [Tepidiforma flava]|uniref:Hemerythrin domain-containing protein n=1 Tax=Tepidiforma flava TaxID=3004094 RepID=A0ABY7M7P3_9CHLR|nr:hemerythrin domain-containing protein [Tepidiforma flava]WBL36435.1 hemerythrin domain-containing protein [Tepidiforma flava]
MADVAPPGFAGSGEGGRGGRGTDEAAARTALAEALRYVQGTLLPASEAEEFTLFPTVDGVFGMAGACEPLKLQHEALREMASDLRKVAAAAEQDGDTCAYGRYLQPLLFGLYGLARAHLESEDAVFLPLLDAHLSESQVNVLVENSERITAAKAAG